MPIRRGAAWSGRKYRTRNPDPDRLAGRTSDESAFAYRWSRAGSLLAGTAVTPSAARRRTAIYVPLLTYRTGPFAGSGIPIADGMHDYLSMLNERDGGIGGVKLAVEECETGYDTKKGVECYEPSRARSPSSSTPGRRASRCSSSRRRPVDKIPILSMAYGLSASARRQHLPVGVHSARHLLGRRVGVRPDMRRRSRAASTSSRARRSA